MAARKRKRETQPPPASGKKAKTGEQTLTSWTIGALPIINRLLERMKLETLLQEHLPPDDARQQVPTPRCLLLLVRNLLVSREPVYGIGEWAAGHAPDLAGLTSRQLSQLNDDRLGRALDRLFLAGSDLLLAVVRQVIEEFGLELDELHNDSTTVSFYGQYTNAAEEKRRRGRLRLAVTQGHSKARRPDLKQLLYTLTVTDDGGVPVYFSSASGNVTDDSTHLETWRLLRELIGRPDFLYVADCKLATTDNLQAIHNRGGRFVTLLPRSRREDIEFRKRLLEQPETIRWEPLYEVSDDEGRVADRFRVCADEAASHEGFRLWWIHSTRKAERDAASRARAIDRTIRQLVRLRERLHLPKTRFRRSDKVEAALEPILDKVGGRWLRVEIHPEEEAFYKQASSGRPGKNTKYVKRVKPRFTISWQIDQEQMAADEAGDGVYPLITNDRELSAEEALRAHKRQPLIEKRFSQFKTDFEVAPVYLKEVTRIQALLCAYFFALMVQTLLERELRRAMQDAGHESLPLYPEGRACKAPTARRVLDVMEPVQRHQLTQDGRTTDFITQLTPLQRQLAQLLDVSPRTYGR